MTESKVYKWKYAGIVGATNERYKQLRREQGGRCAICRRFPKGRALALDHDHITGEIRGLLCTKCNISLAGLEWFASLSNGLTRAFKHLSKKNDTPQVSENKLLITKIQNDTPHESP